MTTALEGGERSAARPGCTLSLRKIQYPLYSNRTWTRALCSHGVDMENFTFLRFLLQIFFQTCCLHTNVKQAVSSVIPVRIYQITPHHSPEDGNHCTQCRDKSNLTLHTAVSAKLTQILGQFLQAFLFLQTGNTEQTATWNTVQRLKSQTDDNTSNSTQKFSYLSLTHWLSHMWQLTHGRLVRFWAQICQAAGLHQECDPNLQLPSWFILLLPRFTLQLIPSGKHIPKLTTDSEGFEIKWFNLTVHPRTMMTIMVKVKVNQSRYRPGVAQGVPGR